MTYKTVTIDALVRWGANPRPQASPDARTTLKASIADKGVLLPLIVRPHGEQEGVYEVVAGDTLEKISTKLYGNPGRWREIFNLNKSKLPRPNALKVGQTLKLPATPSSSSSTRPS